MPTSQFMDECKWQDDVNGERWNSVSHDKSRCNKTCLLRS